jgi:hypothetical protein
MVAFEWLESSDHPQFKTVLDLVRWYQSAYC